MAKVLLQIKLLQQQFMTVSSTLLIFITVLNTVKLCTASSSYSPSTPGRFSRQLRFSGGIGGGGVGIGEDSSSGYIQPYHRRQQSSEVNLFQTMMSLNFDMTEVLAMYRNVTAVAETPGCFGHCRTPMALWVVQSFYPCYNLQKADCPKGLVCCMQDPSSRLVASANTLQDTKVVKGSLVQGLSASHHHNHNHIKVDNKVKDTVTATDVEFSPPAAAAATPSANQPTQSTTLFDEEYFKNNFIQDEIPE